MYQIGLFSKLYRVSSKTLRHYDSIGLLKPALTDAQSGYRFYTADQIPRMNQIVALKALGFSLSEIQDFVDNPDDVVAKIQRREVETLRQISELTHRLEQIKLIQHNMIEGHHMNYNAVVRPLPGGIVASMRFISESYDTFFTIIPKMGEEMKRQGAVCQEPAYCFNIFHDGEYREKEIDVETCELVKQAKSDSEMVQYKKIAPVEQAVCVTHKGGYESIGLAYQYAMEWIAHNKLEVSDAPRESYIDGIWNKSDPTDWLTEIQIPVTAN